MKTNRSLPLSLAFLLLPVEVPAKVLGLVDVNVVSIEQAIVHPHHDILIQDGIIKKITPTGMRFPQDAEVIRLNGHYVIPGLVDSHVHIGFESRPQFAESELLLMLANGVTTIRSMHGTRQILELRQRILSQSLIGPRILTTGPMLAGPRPGDTSTEPFTCITEWACIVRKPEAGRKLVLEHKQAGYDFIKVKEFLAPEVYREIVKTSAKLKMQAVGHPTEFLPMEEIIRNRHQRSFEHLENYILDLEREDSPLRSLRNEALAVQTGIPLIHRDLKKSKFLATLTAKAEVYNVPTLTLLSNTARMTLGEDLSKKYPVEFMDQCWLASQKEWGKLVHQLGGKWANWEGRNLLNEGTHAARTMVKQLHDQGAPIVAGTDGGSWYSVLGFALHDELELYVRSGLTPVQALRTATTNPFKMFKINGGKIEQGSNADLVILSGDPTKDIRNTKKIHAVIAQGNLYQRRELDRMLAKVRSFVASEKCPR